MVWQKNGTPDTLGSAGDVMVISDLTAKIFNQFLVHQIEDGLADFTLTFNSNTNSVYARRQSGNGGTDGTAVSQASVLYLLDVTNDKFSVFNVCSISGEEKLGMESRVTRGTAGAANAPNRAELVFKFVPSPDADITRIDLDNGQAGSYGIDSNLSALGTDTTPFSPDDVAGLIVWLDADDASTITEVSNVVSQWDDKSGEGNDVSQAVEADKPLLVAAAHNGKNTIRFDGSTEYLQRATFVNSTATQQVHIFIVCTMPSGTTGDLDVLDAGAASNRILFGRAATFYRLLAGVDLQSGTNNVAFAQFNLVANGSSSIIRRNKSDVGTGDAGTNGLNGITLAAQFNGLANADIDICEVLIYDASVSTGDRDSIETYLQDKWGVP